LMMVAVLGFGFSTAGNMCMVRHVNFPGCPPRSVVQSLFDLLLKGCGDDGAVMAALDKPTLSMVMMRLQNMQLEGPVQQMK
jgi:hypothetical protein